MMEVNHTKCLNVLFQVFGLTTFTQKSIKFVESKTSVMEIILIIYNLILIVFTSAHFTVLLLIHPIFDSILIYNSITILAYLVALMSSVFKRKSFKKIWKDLIFVDLIIKRHFPSKLLVKDNHRFYQHFASILTIHILQLLCSFIYFLGDVWQTQRW
jgi:hypothetical protein